MEVPRRLFMLDTGNSQTDDELHDTRSFSCDLSCCRGLSGSRITAAPTVCKGVQTKGLESLCCMMPSRMSRMGLCRPARRSLADIFFWHIGGLNVLILLRRCCIPSLCRPDVDDGDGRCKKDHHHPHPAEAANARCQWAPAWGHHARRQLRHRCRKRCRSHNDRLADVWAF